MEVFRIRLDSNRFQSFLAVDSKIWDTDDLDFDCAPRAERWKPPEVYVDYPKLELGDFLAFTTSAFVIGPRATEILRTILEMAGELLPLPYRGETFYLINVLECINCLDQEKTKWVLGERTKTKIRIEEYHFHPDRFPESTLFKIPERSRGEILTVSGLKDPEDEFKSLVEQEGLKGIMFEKLWSYPG